MVQALKALVVVVGAATVAAFAGAVRATVWAYGYRARTGEGFVFAWVLAAWAGVLTLAIVTGLGLLWWRQRR